MITADKSLHTVDGVSTSNLTFYGLRTDSKPTDCGNGSVFIEMDTGKAYFFNASAGVWIEV